jgi:hypothetical protein
MTPTARKRDVRNEHKTWLQKLKEDHWGKTDIDGRMIQK